MVAAELIVGRQPGAEFHDIIVGIMEISRKCEGFVIHGIRRIRWL
jgi:hypothetical protein